MHGGMRVPLLLFVLLLASVLAVPVPSDHSSPDDEIPSGSSDWRIEVVDSDGYVGFYSSIALDSTDHPHIGYVEGDGEVIKYAKWTGDVWIIETVDSSAGWRHYGPSIAIDSNDYPHMSYHYRIGSGNLRYVGWTGSNWTIETVDSDSRADWFTSIALDDDDDPHIGYFVWYDLKYATRTGGVWRNETVDPGRANMFNSIAIDSTGNPHIGYYGIADVDLKYARRNASAWSVETVDAGGDVGGSTSLALDHTDRPHLSYEDLATGDLKYATLTDTGWSVETVDSTGRGSSCTSIAIDESGNPHISYYDYPNGDLKYAGWTGGEWVIETVDSVGVVGLWSSIAVDRNGSPHISYHDATNGDLKYATKIEQPPSHSISLNIDPDTLNLKSKGKWITAYLNAENASVYDINVSSLLLQDTLPPDRWDYQDDVLVLKFNRQEFKDTVQVGESVQVKITGKWDDGTAFE
ncbi:MAG: BNR repeat-containing protein, partial [Candidatus Thermoplasmatota archaeon]|nr:BNR repeat-containing protein [Candidatus Thermoplasmatota archaeon]